MLTDKLVSGVSISPIEIISSVIRRYKTSNQQVIIESLTLIEAENTFVFRGQIDNKRMVGKGKFIVVVSRTGGHYIPNIYIDFSVEFV